MQLVQALHGQVVLLVELQRPAEGSDRFLDPPQRQVAVTAQGVLEDAQPRLDADDVDVIEDERHQEDELVAHLRQFGRQPQQVEPDAEAGAERGDFDFGFFRLAAEGEQVEERQAEQQDRGELLLIAFIREAREGVDVTDGQVDADGADDGADDQSVEFVLDPRQPVEAEAEQGPADGEVAEPIVDLRLDGSRHHAAEDRLERFRFDVRRPFEEQPRGQSTDHAEVNAEGAIEQYEQQEAGRIAEGAVAAQDLLDDAEGETEGEAGEQVADDAPDRIPSGVDEGEVGPKAQEQAFQHVFAQGGVHGRWTPAGEETIPLAAWE